jgi:hypothetical protein
MSLSIRNNYNKNNGAQHSKSHNNNTWHNETQCKNYQHVHTQETTKLSITVKRWNLVYLSVAFSHYAIRLCQVGTHYLGAGG